MALGIVSDKDFDIDIGNCGSTRTPVETPSSQRESPVEEIVEEQFPILPSASEEYPLIPIDQILSGEIVLPVPRGRNGAKETPEILRKIIGEEAAIAGRDEGLKLAESFGISPSSTSAYSNSATSTATYDKKSPAIEDFIKSRKNRIIKKASAKMIAAIDGITEDKLLEAPAGVLAGIARSLSGVVRDLEPPVREEKATNVQFIMYAPRLISESSMETIQVNE